MNDHQIQSKFQRYMRPGERIAWTGRPPRGLRFSGRDIFLVPFSLLWGGFAIVWETAVLGISLSNPSALNAVPSFMALFGAVFVLIGLFMIFGRFWVDAWIRSHTIYALTDRRALSLRLKPAERLLATDLKEPRVSRREDDTGSLTFARGSGVTNLFTALANPTAGWSMWIPALSDEVTFVGIQDVTRVYQLATPATAAP
jgi:hypothetical protein